MTLNYGNQLPAYPPVGFPGNIYGQNQNPQWNAVSVPAPQYTYPGYYDMPYNQVYGAQSAPAPVTNAAVKIDINGATVNGSGGQTPSAGGFHNMPMYPGRTQMMMPPPQYMPPAYPPADTNAQMPPYMTPQAPPPQHAPIPMPMPVPIQQIPVLPPPPMIQQPNIQTPPPMIDQQKAQPVQTAEQAPAIAQQSPIDPAVQPLFQALNAITPQPGQIVSLQDQLQSIQTIAQFAKTAQAANDMIKAEPTNPTAIQSKDKVDKLINPLLIDEKTFKGLTSIAINDTSSYSGTDKQKAEENKLISMWTLAMLQKLFREEMNKELQKENIPPMSIGEIPGVSHLVGNIKSDPNPAIREGGIVALMEVADPKNPKDSEIMKTLLQTAIKQDHSEDVVKTATNALNEFKN